MRITLAVVPSSFELTYLLKHMATKKARFLADPEIWENLQSRGPEAKKIHHQHHFGMNVLFLFSLCVESRFQLGCEGSICLGQLPCLDFPSWETVQQDDLNIAKTRAPLSDEEEINCALHWPSDKPQFMHNAPELRRCQIGL